jgi:predicted anti-sigma-YlaC factor YlaD
MTCSRIRDAISARLDGETPGLDARAVQAHLDDCAGCRGFLRDAEALHRAARLGDAPPIPDNTARILAAIGEYDAGTDHDTQLALRWVLAAVALVQIAIAVPALVLGNDAGLPVHAARHIGSFDVALAVGFLFAAWRPARISGLLPVVAALVACLLASSILDVAAGNTAATSELQHVTDFAGLAVVWLLSRPLPRAIRFA